MSETNYSLFCDLLSRKKLVTWLESIGTAQSTKNAALSRAAFELAHQVNRNKISIWSHYDIIYRKYSFKLQSSVLSDGKLGIIVYGWNTRNNKLTVIGTINSEGVGSDCNYAIKPVYVQPKPTRPPSPTVSSTPVTPSVTPSITSSRSPGISPCESPTPSISVTPSITVIPSNSITPSVTLSITPSITPGSSSSITPSVSLTPSNTVTPSNSITPGVTASNTPSLTPSETFTPSITPSVSLTPSNSVTPSIPGASNSVSPTPTLSVSSPQTGNTIFVKTV